MAKAGSFGAGSLVDAGTSGRGQGGTTSGGGSPDLGGALAAAGIPATGRTFVPQNARSCQNLSTTCQAESCCTSISMPGGNFLMGRSQVVGSSDYYSTTWTEDTPEHSATVAAFALDKYEVTLGRFRQFVAAYDSWRQSHPSQLEGANPNAEYTGWGESWEPAMTDLPTTAAELVTQLKCVPPYFTWRDTVGASDRLAINCVTWFEAFAFCIWDGGRLPTEAEWEYAATGGPLNRLYPWGGTPPDLSLANYSASNSPMSLEVGSKPNGAGYYGHRDLAGSMWELVFDWYSEGFYGTTAVPVSCHNCANAIPANWRVRRGGSWNEMGETLRAAKRYYTSLDYRIYDTGFRCARPAQ